MRCRSYVVLCCLTMLATFGYAEDEAKPSMLTGDWGGARTALAQRGLEVESSLWVDPLRNRGGIEAGGKTVVQFDLKLKADFAPMVGWEGGSGMLHVFDLAGAGLNTQRVGSFMGVTNVETPTPTARVFEAWLQQTVMDGQLSFLAGLYPIDSEFFGLAVVPVVFGPMYGPPADLSLTRGPSIFSNSAFGLRAKWQAKDRTWYAMGAVLDGVPGDPARPKATSIRFAQGDGAFNIGEIGWRPQADNDKFVGDAKFAFGLWGYSAKVDDLIDVDANGAPLKRRSRGGYVLGEHTLRRLGDEGKRYISGFARYSWNDGASVPLGNALNLGGYVRGPVESRPDDTIFLGWSRGGLSSKFRDQAGAGATAAAEETLELQYRVQLYPWLALQPVVQRIRHPGGGATTPTAKIYGVRLEVLL